MAPPLCSLQQLQGSSTVPRFCCVLGLRKRTSPAYRLPLFIVSRGKWVGSCYKLQQQHSSLGLAFSVCVCGAEGGAEHLPSFRKCRSWYLALSVSL